MTYDTSATQRLLRDVSPSAEHVVTWTAAFERIHRIVGALIHLCDNMLCDNILYDNILYDNMICDHMR